MSTMTVIMVATPKRMERVSPSLGGGLEIGSEAGQAKVARAENKHFAGHEKKPAACDGHHRIPHQSDGGERQLDLDETLPPAEAVNPGGFAHFRGMLFSEA